MRNKRFTFVVLLLICLAQFVFFESFFAVFSWLFFFFVGRKIIQISFKSHPEYINLYLFSFLIISFIGLTIHLDNLRNFNTYFGFAGDDYSFFTKISDVYKNGIFPVTGLYEYVVSIFYAIFQTIKLSPVTLIDILPINWVLTGLTVVLIKHLQNLIFKKSVPDFIIISAVLLNFDFSDSSSRLYRDIFVIFLSVISIIYLVKNQKKQFFFFTFLTGLVRGANGVFLLLFYGLMKLRQKVNSKIKILSFSILIVVSGIVLLQKTDIIMYLTAANRIKNFSSSLSNFSNSLGYITFRDKKILDETFNKSKFLGNNIKSGGILATGTRLFAMALFPLTIHSPYGNHKIDTYLSLKENFNGPFYYQAIKMIFILNWIFILPYILIGFFSLWKDFNIINSTILLFYLIVLPAITFISGQPRHTMILVVMNSLIASLGYHIIHSGKKRALHKILIFGTFIFIIGWNILRHTFLT